MFDDYRDELIIAYNEKKENGTLALNLTSLAPGKVRDECQLVYRERFSEDDNETLRSFFGNRDALNGYSQLIENVDIDRFRPLINFINRRTSNTERRNIELLAWLIDFKPRSYSTWLTQQVSKKEKFKETDEKTRILDTPWKKIGSIAAVAVIILVLSIKIHNIAETSSTAKTDDPENTKITKILTSNPHNIRDQTNSSITNNQCMYWTGDYYKAVSCNEVLGDTPIIALEARKLNLLKRVTRPDTLSKKDLTKTWYARVNMDSVQFFTDSGSNPLNEQKKLRPLTQYILNKYPDGFNIYKRQKTNRSVLSSR